MVSNDCPYESDPNGPYSRVKTMTVHATGGAVQDYASADTTPWSASPPPVGFSLGWQDEAYFLESAGKSTVLTFTSTSVSACGPTIGKVVVTTKADCKKGGWKSMADRYGTPFKNQGDCQSYFATKERNLAAGG